MKNFLLTLMATLSLAVFTAEPIMAATDKSCGTNDLSVNISDVVNGQLTLTFTGTGEFNDYTEVPTPWATDAAKTAVKTIKIVWGANVADASFVFYPIRAKVTTVEVAEGVTSLPFGLCGGFNKLSTLVFSSTVSDISADFLNTGVASVLDSISVAAGNATYSTPSGSNALIHNASHTLIRACSKTVIPAGVQKIGEGAFSTLATLPDTLVLAEGITTIEKDAFKNCKGLKNIVLSSTLTTIGDYAFNGCTNIVAINLPVSVRTLGAHAFDINASKPVMNVLAETPATIGTNALKGSYKIIAANCGLLPAYRSAWEEYQKRISGAYPYELTVAANDDSFGTVEILQNPDCDNPAVVKATAFNGYSFSRWTLKGEKVGKNLTTDSIMLADIAEDVQLVAEFVAVTALGDLQVSEPVSTDGLQVTVACAKAGQVALYDLTGRMVAAQEAEMGANVALQAPKDGVYVLRTPANVTKVILK